MLRVVVRALGVVTMTIARSKVGCLTRIILPRMEGESQGVTGASKNLVENLEGVSVRE